MLSSRVACLMFLVGFGGALSSCGGSPFTRATGEDRDASEPVGKGNAGADARAPGAGGGGATPEDSGRSAGGADARAPGERADSSVDGGAGGAGSGDASGSGGAASSGGTVGSGAIAGSGGVAGSGGTPGSSGGTSAGGSTGSGGGSPKSFPTTPVLDNFGRQALGANWIGATAAFTISNGKLGCTDCGAPVLWSREFGARQEAYFTVAGFDVLSNELNVVMKAQSTDCDQIEILYAPDAGQLRVDYCYDGRWREQAGVAWTLHLGDRFGGRAYEDGTVEVFVNGNRVAAYDLADYPFARGRIGVSGIAADGTVNAIDDFGGGEF
jgi:hypothetical protein